MFAKRNKTKTFLSNENWFEMELPENWQQYENEDGTYAFFDPTEWKGNFRITSIKLGKTVDDTLLEDYFSEGAQKIMIGKYICAHYKEYSKTEDEDSILYYWHFNNTNLSFICSFTTDIEKENTPTLRSELLKIESIIESVSLL